MSFSYLKELALDSKVITKDSLVPSLELGLSEAAINGNPDTTILAQLIDALSAWDGFAKKEYSAPSLYYILRSMTPDTINFATTSGIDSIDRIVLMNSLLAAKSFMINNFGTVDKPWGEIHGILRNNIWYPLNGGTTAKDNMDANRLVNGNIDSFFRINVDRGNQFMIIIRLKSGEEPQAWVMKPYGQSSDPDSPHFDDMTELYASDSLRPTWFSEDAFTANAESIETASCESVTKTNEKELQDEISIYPNPTTGLVRIKGRNIHKISIVDLTGKIVDTYQASKYIETIDLRNKSKGIYLLSVVLQGKTYVEKIILK